jgi:hypothetical protein
MRRPPGLLTVLAQIRHSSKLLESEGFSLPHRAQGAAWSFPRPRIRFHESPARPVAQMIQLVKQTYDLKRYFF